MLIVVHRIELLFIYHLCVIVKKLFERLKVKWEIRSNWDVLAILIVFAISGSSILFVKPIWYKMFGITEATPTWLRWLVWTAMVFPTYQGFLLIYGFLLGQFKFFWAKEKAMYHAVTALFKKLSVKKNQE